MEKWRLADLERGDRVRIELDGIVVSKSDRDKPLYDDLPYLRAPAAEGDVVLVRVEALEITLGLPLELEAECLEE